MSISKNVSMTELVATIRYLVLKTCIFIKCLENCINNRDSNERVAILENEKDLLNYIFKSAKKI